MQEKYLDAVKATDKRNMRSWHWPPLLRVATLYPRKCLVSSPESSSSQTARHGIDECPRYTSIVDQSCDGQWSEE